MLIAPRSGQIDSARTYTGGTSEEYLGKIGWKKRGLVMDTKLYPTVVRIRDHIKGGYGTRNHFEAHFWLCHIGFTCFCVPGGSYFALARGIDLSFLASHERLLIHIQDLRKHLDASLTALKTE